MDVTFSLIEITTTTASESFTFPATGTVDVAVDWGDGSAVETFTSTPISHTFTTADTYTVKISGSIGGLTIDGSGSEAQFAGQFIGAGLTWTGTDFDGAFRDSDVTSCDLSLSDTSSVTDFARAWRDCSNLTSLPLLDTSSGTIFYYAWAYCSNLTSFPLIDTSSGINFVAAWYGCSSLTSFPLIDTSSSTSFYYTWYGCSSLTSFPLIDTSSGENFERAWYNCSSLTSFPLIDTSSGTSFIRTWYNCSGLTSFPLLDTSSVTNFALAWYGCSGLTSFPLLDTSSSTSFYYTWNNCSSLTSFPANMFDTCLCTDFTNAFFNCALTQSSVDNILVSIDTAGQSNGTLNIGGGTSSSPSATGLAAKTSLEGKGWTVTTN